MDQISQNKTAAIAASNNGNIISRNKQLIDMICLVKRIFCQLMIAFDDHLNDLAWLSHDKTIVL